METKKWWQSKTVWNAIIMAALSVTEAIGNASGHPITIPSYVYVILTSLGLYTARTSEKPIV